MSTRPVPTSDRGGDVAEMLRRVHLLELIARRNAAGLRPGDYRTAVRGQGLELHEMRKYVPGDPVRSIDWNVTARTGEPHVRVHLEERRRDVIVCVDVSPSMHAGSQRKTKLELAVELAATLAVSAIDAGDRLGHVLFADRVLAEGRPRGGRAQLFRTLRALLDHVGPWRRPVTESDPRAAIHAVEQRRGRFVVFLISDFLDHDLPDDLRYARARHDVSLLHVYDPLEYAAGPVRVPGVAPEGAARGMVTSDPATADATGLQAMQAFLRARCGELRMAFASLATDQDVRAGLEHFFHRKRAAR